jgi:hypothetical protein
MHFFSHTDLQSLLANLFSLCVSYWEYELFLECASKYAPLYVMVIVAIVVNPPSGGLPQNLK